MTQQSLEDLTGYRVLIRFSLWSSEIYDKTIAEVSPSKVYLKFEDDERWHKISDLVLVEVLS